METDAESLALINERCPDYDKNIIQLTCAVDAASGGKFNGTGADCAGKVTASYVQVCTPTKRNFCVTTAHDAGNINDFNCSNPSYSTEDTCGSCSDTSKSTKATCVDYCPTGVPQADCGICSEKCSAEISAGDDIRSVFIADVNGDSKDDVLVASFADDTVAWYKRMADGTFQKNNIATDCDGAIKIIGLDWDHDGDLDVIAFCKNSNSVYGNLQFYTNDGSGSFTFKTSSVNSKHGGYQPFEATGEFHDLACDSYAKNQIICGYRLGSDNTGIFDIMDISGTNLVPLNTDSYGNYEWNEVEHIITSKNFLMMGNSGTSQLAATANNNNYLIIYRYNAATKVNYQTQQYVISDCGSAHGAGIADLDSDGKEDLVAVCEIK